MKTKLIQKHGSDEELSQHVKNHLLSRYFINKNVIFLFLGLLLSFSSFSQQRTAGIERKDVSAAPIIIDNATANFNFTILTDNTAEFTIQIFKNGELYVVESKIPGTNLKLNKKNTAKLVAEVLIKKLQRGQSTVFSEEEIKALENY